MTDNKGFIFYRSFYEACKDLPEDEFKKCMLSLMKYGLDGIYEPDGAVAMMFLTMAKPQIDANNKRRENGKRGGRPKEEISSKRFEVPTVEEVQKYCDERNNHVDAQRFVDFYSAKGWQVGKNKMKDWRAAVRTWERKNSESKQTRNQGIVIPKPDWWTEE